jgi:uncharacterized protein (DUF488 family)
MLFTIGYQKIDSAFLLNVLNALGPDSLLIDVRSSPSSRKKAFDGAQLKDLLGARYVFAGEHLGGRKPVTQAGLNRLKALSDERNVIIMCMEHAPGDCHRHHAICKDHFPEALHIFEGHLIAAYDLEVAIKSKSDEILAAGTIGDILNGGFLLS